jgi:hypothetical protein
VNKKNDLSFPFNQRWGMAFWNLLFLSERVPVSYSAKLNQSPHLRWLSLR